MNYEKINEFFEKTKNIEGYFGLGSSFFFSGINQFQKNLDVRGDLFEIGVHEGKSALYLATMRSRDERLGLCDLFCFQDQNISKSRKGNKEKVLENFEEYFGNLDFLRIHEKNSLNLSPDEIGNNYRFFHIDGGHSSEETLNDLNLANKCINDKGVVIVDDVFNYGFPDVSVGVCKFMSGEDKLIPFAIGTNKTFFCKPDMYSLYYEEVLNGPNPFIECLKERKKGTWVRKYFNNKVVIIGGKNL